MNTIEEKVIQAFKQASKSVFYNQILTEKGIDPSSIQSLQDFSSKVPIIEKSDVFGRFKVSELVTPEVLNGMASAIISSGTSGAFSYAVLTNDDVAHQRGMIDGLFKQFFDADACPPIIINSLPMGVTFSSSYPVVPTGVRADIALEVIRTFLDLS